MNRSEITNDQENAFLEDATNDLLDCADRHNVSHAQAEVSMLGELIRDLHMADPAALRAFVLATLDLCDFRGPSIDMTALADALRACELHEAQLVAAMDKLDADTVIEPATVTGARLQ